MREPCALEVPLDLKRLEFFAWYRLEGVLPYRRTPPSWFKTLPEDAPWFADLALAERDVEGSKGGEVREGY